ncbi:longitudinals lacking protein, isoforms F/I/K/T isoform X3 [Pieris rapae]|uniref:longitudinals lacking protein, isoforms F/I/K/T isoform X3 n=1 Tax=Pieris rapae TaxID=64459 RepID=UPI000B925E2B|nr:longitudinals lacking protein, isoforms F/I/K/T isoform X3 [Pieris rapae]
MDDDQQFCLRWNNHQSTLVSVFDTLLEKGIHVDCTLAAEGQTLKAHKVVLSACSPYFENVLSQQFDKHPIIILKDVKYAELRAMMDYMYRGEVNISQDQLAALLKAAESLQIKGLSDNKPSRPPSRPSHVTLPPAHPPRAPSPPPQSTELDFKHYHDQQVRDGSIDSREGSMSPTRRRKKVRRLSNEQVTPVAPLVPEHEEMPCKEEVSRDGVEDLTLDEDAGDPPAQHNDVVRNFQWHMERSQDEIMNSNDSVRDSQGDKTPARGIMTRSKKVCEEATATTLAILKNVTKIPEMTPPEESKENKKQAQPKERAGERGEEARCHILPRGSAQLPCAQYKTEKGYKCPNCQRCYNARKNLVRHVTLECGREPQYKCPYCTYSKHRRNELKKHVEKKHPDCMQLAASPSPVSVK